MAVKIPVIELGTIQVKPKMLNETYLTSMASVKAHLLNVNSDA